MTAKLKIVPDQSEPPIRIGPSLKFLRLTRNPALPSPVRFKATVKGDGDVVI
jgi:hypothetical protein